MRGLSQIWLLTSNHIQLCTENRQHLLLIDGINAQVWPYTLSKYKDIHE